MNGYGQVLRLGWHNAELGAEEADVATQSAVLRQGLRDAALASVPHVILVIKAVPGAFTGRFPLDENHCATTLC